MYGDAAVPSDTLLQWRRSCSGSSGHGRCTFSCEKNKLKYRVTYNFHDTSSIDVIQSAEQLLLVNYSLYEHVLM